jgi:hypothetical protein
MGLVGLLSEADPARGPRMITAHSQVGLVDIKSQPPELTKQPRIANDRTGGGL